MYNHMIRYIDKEDILYKFQFGFHKSHSTNQAIISLVEKVNQALDSGKVLVRIFLDLKKNIRYSRSQNSSRQTFQIWYMGKYF